MRAPVPVWKKLLMSVLSVVFTLALVEGGARLWSFAQYGVRQVDGQPQGLYISAPGEAPRLRPGVHLKGLLYEVSVNSIGTRGPELLATKPPNGLRVWCIGGSTTFDIYAPDDAHTWPAVAQTHLQEAFPDKVVEVINAGVPGEILEGSANALHAHGRRLGIDVVVLYHGANDLRAISMQEQGPPPGGFGPPLLRSMELLSVWMQRRGIGVDAMPDRPTSQHHLRQLEQRLQRMEREVSGLGAVPIYATHAHRIADDATGAALNRQSGELGILLGMSPTSSRDWFAMYNGLVQRRAQQTRQPLADVRAAVGSDPALWGDATHFSAEGSAIAGKVVADAIIKKLRR